MNTFVDTWRTPLLLVGLSLVPAIAGGFRVVEIASGSPAPETARFFHTPGPVLLHVVAATLYALGGAFQFSRGLRRRWPGWHRVAGRVLAVCGVLSATTGVFMAVATDIPLGMQGPLLLCVRVIVGAAMVAFIGFAWRTAVTRDFVAHEGWMTRAYALGLGAGTQVVVLGPWALFGIEPLGLTRDLLMLFAWLLNLAFVEWLLRRKSLTTARASGSLVRAGH